MASTTMQMEEIPDTMIEAHIDKDTNVSLHEVPVPLITNPHHIIVKVVCTACNPKDWKMPAGLLTTIADCPNSGDDIAGIVAAVGEKVLEFRPGDRVAGLHQLGQPYGSYAEYALLWDHATFHLGHDVSFEDAAVYPMAVITSSMALFGMLRITPQPWAPLTQRRPLVIYGAASSVGLMGVQFARNAGIHPLICVAGGGAALVEEFLDRSKGDTIIDYRNGDDAVAQGIKDALQGQKLCYAYDAISENGSYITLGKILDPENGKITMTLANARPGDIPAGIERSVTMANSLWRKTRFLGDRGLKEEDVGELGLSDGAHEFGVMFTRLVGKWLRDGKLKTRPYEVLPGGLNSVEQALKSLRSGDTGKKYVVRIQDTSAFQRREG